MYELKPNDTFIGLTLYTYIYICMLTEVHFHIGPVLFLMVSDYDGFVIENRHSSCSLQEGEWPDQGERQTPGDGGACHPPVQGEFPCERWLTSGCLSDRRQSL